MKTYREIKVDLAKQYGYSSWDMLLKGSLKIQDIENEAAQIYARQVAQDALSRAVDCARLMVNKGNHDSIRKVYNDQVVEVSVSPKSIKETEIITP